MWICWCLKANYWTKVCWMLPEAPGNTYQGCILPPVSLLSAAWKPQAIETSAQCLWTVWSTSPSQSRGYFLTQLNKTKRLLAYFLQSSALHYPLPGKLGCADRTSLFALVPIPKPRTKVCTSIKQKAPKPRDHPTSPHSFFRVPRVQFSF